MTVVSNDPSWWPVVNSNVLFSYWLVAAGIVVVYDWVLTLGREVELIWKQRRSLMTVLYLAIRYIGILFSVTNVLAFAPFISLTDAVSNILYCAINMTCVVVTAMLGVIMIARLHTMYGRSRMILLILVVIFLAVNIACGVMAAVGLKDTVAEEMIISGTYMCHLTLEGNAWFLNSMSWMLYTIWEVIALCLSVWIAVKHFHDLRRLGPSTGSTIGDCFRVLMQSHVLYFARAHESKFLWNSDTSWCSSDFIGCANVCAGTTPHP
ncbi:uncharacterized protein F5147DRAFT_275511 [Suillus discolor]|uniref:DUF6533 domain-containing protein n=1 Tax=Suillus discolor TaxID=1912936 RepID=A0A9P7JSB8_9AGAM|nr:uncharacterized protein F5147DRAFT_275511 [Suillus discolor]KAG2103771.1 hypothetical protein F5147DRAFT_275511 [Suillus discolor]